MSNPIDQEIFFVCVVKNSKYRATVNIRIHQDLDNTYTFGFFSSLTMTAIALLGSFCERSWDLA